MQAPTTPLLQLKPYQAAILLLSAQSLFAVLPTPLSWDGSNTTYNGVADGGTGTWNAASTNWTNGSPGSNVTWNQGNAATFGGTAGTVTIAGNFTPQASSLTFLTDGYNLTGTGNLQFIGEAVIDVQDGLTASIGTSISSDEQIEKTGNGTLNLTGVSNYSGNARISEGTLTISGDGSLTTTGNFFQRTGFVSVGSSEGIAALNVTNTGELNVTNFLLLGDAANMTGEMTVDKGSTVKAEVVGIGVSENSIGQATVSGADSRIDLNTGIIVGFQGFGELLIEDGGVVSASSDTNIPFAIASSLGSVGKITVDGSGSKLEQMGENTDADFYVGDRGNGELLVQNGGYVKVEEVIAGSAASSEGRITIDGSESEMKVVRATIGDAGLGELNVLNGANFETEILTIGSGASNSGNVLIKGSNSSVTVTQRTTLGSSGGTAAITIAEGGQLDTGIIFMSTDDDSIGTINIGEGGDAGIIITQQIVGYSRPNSIFEINLNHSEADYYLTTDGTAGGDMIELIRIDSLQHIGTGQTTLTGTVSLTEETGVAQINAGKLNIENRLSGGSVQINDGGTLGGSGTIAAPVEVFSGGSLEPGSSAGTMTIESTLALRDGSSTNMEIFGPVAGTGHDQIVVSETISLGGDLNLIFSEGGAARGEYTLLMADPLDLTSDSITGEFANVNVDFARELQFETEIMDDDYILRILAVQSDFRSYSFQSSFDRTLAAILDLNYADSAIIPIIDELNKFSEADLPAAFDLMNPSELAVIGRISRTNSLKASNRIGNRLHNLRKGAKGFSTAGFNLHDDNGQQISHSLLASAEIPTGVESQEIGDANEASWSYFISGSATFSEVEADGDNLGFDDDNYAVLMGADYRAASDLVVGVYGGYDNSDTNLGGNGGDSDLASYRLGLHGTWWKPVAEGQSAASQQVFVEGHLGAAYHELDYTRTALGGESTADTKGHELATGLAFGYEIEHESWIFTTKLALDYMQLWLDGYTESNGIAPLAINDNSSEALYSTISFRAETKVEWANTQLRPYAELGWRHQYMDDSESITARFAGSAAESFTASGSSYSRDSLTIATGVSAQIKEGLTIQLGYWGEHNSQIEIHSINASLNLAF